MRKIQRLMGLSILALSSMIGGCENNPVSLHPRIVIDMDFSDTETANVYEAMAGWQDVVPEISTLSYTRMNHHQIMEFAGQSSLPEGTVLILALPAIESGAECPGYGILSNDHFAIRHYMGEDLKKHTASIICVNMYEYRTQRDYAHEQAWLPPVTPDWSPDLFRAIIGHELGHTMGLEHSPEDGKHLMEIEQHADLTPYATCEDALDMSKLHAVSVADHCLSNIQ